MILQENLFKEASEIWEKYNLCFSQMENTEEDVRSFIQKIDWLMHNTYMIDERDKIVIDAVFEVWNNL